MTVSPRADQGPQGHSLAADLHPSRVRPGGLYTFQLILDNGADEHVLGVGRGRGQPVRLAARERRRLLRPRAAGAHVRHTGGRRLARRTGACTPDPTHDPRRPPASVDATTAYVRDEVMPTVREMDGCVGLSMLADRDTGRCIVTTSWRDEAALHSSADDVRPSAERTAELLGGPAGAAGVGDRRDAPGARGPPRGPFPRHLAAHRARTPSTAPSTPSGCR